MDRWLTRVGGLLSLVLVLGCGGDPNDPATWVEKLDRGTERQDAVSKLRELYRNELNKNDGNADAAPVKAIASKMAQGLIDAARKYKDDRESRKKILELLGEIRDRRAIPLFIEALDFTPELTEDEAIAGAEGLGQLEAREGVEPLVAFLDRITGNRPVDNRMKRAVVEAFGRIRDPAAIPAMIKLLDTPADQQDFFINKLTAIALEQIPDERAIPALIRALYTQGRGAGIFQQARVALAALGPRAIPGLVKAMKRQDEDLNRLNKALEFDVLNPGIQEEKIGMILADLGDPAAIPALLELLETGGWRPVVEEPDAEEADKVSLAKAVCRGRAGNALAEIATSEADISRIVDAIMPYASELPQSAHNDLYRAMASTGQPRVMEFLKKRMMDRRGYGEVVRFWAADWYAHWGRKGVKADIERFLSTEPSGVISMLENDVDRIRARADASEQCDEDVQCWVGKLEDEKLGGQAADRLGLLGLQGSEEARAALLSKANHQDKDVRRAVLAGINRAYPAGCSECIERLEAIIAAEGGRQRLEITHNDIRVIIHRFRHRGASGGSAAGGGG